MIDNMAERYGKLPSEIMQSATTFDLFICDTAITYRNMVEAEARGEHQTPKIAQDQLEEMIRRTRNDKT